MQKQDGETDLQRQVTANLRQRRQAQDDSERPVVMNYDDLSDTASSSGRAGVIIFLLIIIGAIVFAYVSGS